MSARSVHTAVTNGNVYANSTSDSVECDDNGNGGGPSGLECSTETFIIEVWNETYGTWDYYDTVVVEVCT